MSKSKRKKAEARKVKIKLGKKLPKNVNESKGTFKSAKIVIREQHIYEPSTSLRLTEILSRIKNKHRKSKNQAIQNLNNFFESTSNLEQLLPHINQIIESFFPSMFDDDFIVRKNFRKTLASLIKKINLAPFIDKIDNFLECSLSHALHSVKFDTLNVLNLLLPKFSRQISIKLVKLLSNLLHVCSSELIFDHTKLKNAMTVLLQYFQSCGKTRVSNLRYFLPDKYNIDPTESIDVVLAELAGNLTQILLQKTPDCGQIDLKSDFAGFAVDMFALIDLILDIQNGGEIVWVAELASVMSTIFPLTPSTSDHHSTKTISLLNLRICRVLSLTSLKPRAVDYLFSMWRDFNISQQLLTTSWLFVGESQELLSLLIRRVFDSDVVTNHRLGDVVVSACDHLSSLLHTPTLGEVIPPLLPILGTLDAYKATTVLQLCHELTRMSESFSHSLVTTLIGMIDAGTMETVLTDELSLSFVHLFVALTVTDLCRFVGHFVKIYHLLSPLQLEFFITSVSARMYYCKGEYCSLLLSLVLGVPACRLGTGDVRDVAMRCEESRSVVAKCVKSVDVPHFDEFCVSKIRKLVEDSVVDEETCALLIRGI